MHGNEIDSSIIANVAGYLIAGLVIVYQWLQLNRRSAKEIISKIDSIAKEKNLSAREVEVFKLLLDGMSNSKIHEVLFIADSTVKTHRQNIYKKLKVSNTGELHNLVRGF